MKSTETLAYLDDKHLSEVKSKFNELGFVEFLKHVEANVVKDFQDFYEFMRLFDGVLTSSNQDLIDEDLIKSVIDNETLDRITTVFSFVLSYFRDVTDDLPEDVVRLTKDKMVHYSTVVFDYTDYLGDSKIEIEQYLDYINYIKSGNKHISFAEFTNKELN